ncbi:MAG: nucleotidyltransferase domain-containing protein [Acidobacteriota bacterium]
MVVSKITPTEITQMVNRIVDQFNPEKIILFGSHARGTAGPDSDADLLVVMPVEGSKRRQATEIDLALFGIDMPADIVVVTPEELERQKDVIRTFVHPAVREGRVVYERES